MNGKVLIAMSGGVDSAAALLLRDRGYDCIGCTMKLYDNAGAGVDRRRTCCSLDDVEDARAAAFRLGIPHYVFNFQEEFRGAILEEGAPEDFFTHPQTRRARDFLDSIQHD